MIFLGIILIFASLFLACLLNFLRKENNNVELCVFLTAISFFCFYGSINCFSEYFNPSIEPIDVYRGNTTLEITYKDGVAIDSIVVWKEK